MPKSKSTKGKKKTKKVVKKVEEVEEVEESEEELSVQEELLLEESNDLDENVLNVSKVPDFNDELTTLKNYAQNLDDATRLKVYLENLMPWLDSRLKKRKEEANNDRKLQQMWLDKLKRTSTNLSKDFAAKAKRKAKASNSSKAYGFTKPTEVPAKLMKFFKDNLPDTFETGKVDKQGNPKKVIISEMMQRPMMTAAIYHYIQQNDLFSENDKRIMIPDDTLKKLFGKALKAKENLTFQNLQPKLSTLFTNSKTKNKGKSKNNEV